MFKNIYMISQRWINIFCTDTGKGLKNNTNLWEVMADYFAKKAHCMVAVFPV